MLANKNLADDIITQSSSDPSIQLALIPPPVDGGEFNARAPYYRE